MQRFLSYMPSHARQTPPRCAPRAGGDMATIADVVPEARNRAYDMTRIVRRLCDSEEILEVKLRFARTIVTALGRVPGRVVGFLANQPMHRAGRRRRRRVRQGCLVPRAVRLLQTYRSSSWRRWRS